MARFNPDFWEISTDSSVLDRVAADRGLWHETDTDRERRHAFKEFFAEVSPVVFELIEEKLTRRQREVVTLYYVHGKTQEDIAIILNLTQSTVSRHLFGTVRAGKKIGGAIPKLRKIIGQAKRPEVTTALETLQERLVAA